MDEHGPDVPEEMLREPIARKDNELFPERKYLHGLADLIDRLTIVLLKQIFITEHSAAYEAERALIEHDIGLLMCEKGELADPEQFVTAVAIIMLANRAIWESEAAARAGGTNTLDQLRFTHSINGLRSRAKNVIARKAGERVDVKVDSFAADLVEDFGNWNILPD